MDGTVTRSAEELSREDLHGLVWQAPLNKLGPQLGTDGPGLAALCRRRRVPTPPPGYWQKKEVGRAPPTTPLPPSVELPAKTSATAVPTRLRTKRSEPSPAPPSEAEPGPEPSPAAEEEDGLDLMRDLHPKVRAWVAEHRQEQQKRREENRRRKDDFWGWSSPALGNLTERDRYRFRASSTLFRAVEKEGGKVGEALIAGKVTFLVAGQKLACLIAEKMTRPMKPPAEAGKWTAYPHNHQTGLVSTGFLRVRFDTYVGGRQRDWIETPKRKVAALLSEIVEAIIAAGPVLAEEAREREEQHRRYQQEQAERYERQRLQEIDDKRWSRFQKRADRWEERDRLLGFIAELRRRLEAEGDATVEGRPLSGWIVWAEERAEALDPFRQGLRGLFEDVTRPEYPTYG
jgi:hypothetical protein